MSNIDHRSDGMMSVLNRVSTERARFGDTGPTSLYTPDTIYATDGIAAVIIDRPAEDAVAGGFTIEGDDSNDILNEFDRLDAWPVLTDALRWSRLHGGAAILMFVDDGLPIDQPLDINRIRVVEDLICFSSSQMTAGASRYADPSKRNYGWPSTYRISPQFGGSFEVHESRLAFVAGETLPPSQIQASGFPWLGKSALDGCFADLCRYRVGLKLSQAIMERKQQLVFSMSDLGRMLESGLDEVVAKRIGIADAVRGVFNLLAIDAADKITLADSDLSGIDSVVKDYKIALCASSRLTMPILFGEQVSGLNANSTGMQSIYENLVSTERTKKYKPLIERLAGVIWAQKVLPRAEPQAWQVKFKPLSQPSDREQAETENIRAQARKNHMDAVSSFMDTQAATPEEVRAASAIAFPELALGLDVPNLPDDVTGETRTTRVVGGVENGLQS